LKPINNNFGKQNGINKLVCPIRESTAPNPSTFTRIFKMQINRLNQQIQFIIEIDKLKHILRQTLLIDTSRRENSAEHSWHIAIMAIILAEYAPESVDQMRAIKMLLIHDLVEIDAGDTFCYDVQGYESKAEKEAQAAKRLFGLLPVEQGSELKLLWEEFEEQNTPTAKFAAALDRIQPVLHNQQTEGGTWRIHGITRDKVMKRVAPVETGAPQLWAFIQQLIDDCVAAGYLQDTPVELEKSNSGTIAVT
jgi:putative hydrolases of HD superfamily